MNYLWNATFAVSYHDVGYTLHMVMFCSSGENLMAGGFKTFLFSQRGWLVDEYFS